MPTGHVKVFHADRNFGRITDEEGGEVIFDPDALSDGTAVGSGDEVEFELAESDNPRERRATTVTVTKKAPAENPVGRTLAAPPTWDTLEEADRQRRQARRRRR